MPDVVAADIGLDDAPRRRRDVTEVVQDGEALIYEPDGSKHHLNWVATVLWHCLDGSVTLRQLSDDLETVLGLDAERARAEVRAYARALGEQGLLHGVRCERSPGAGAGSAGPATDPGRGRQGT